MSYFTEWYNRLSDDERKEYNKNRYLKYKERMSKQSKEWAKKHPLHMQASTHTTAVKRKYPKAITEDSPTSYTLKEWLDKKQGECVYCGDEAKHIDHIIPLSKGGLHTFENLQLICRRCNVAKNNDTVEEFLAWAKRLSLRQLGN
jgi:5-methylcytosine-specific restriction endonuclease McrA